MRLLIPSDLKVYSKIHDAWVSAVDLAKFSCQEQIQCWNGRGFQAVNFMELEHMPDSCTAYAIDSVTKVGVYDQNSKYNFDFHWKPIRKKTKPKAKKQSPRSVLQAVHDFCLDRVLDDKLIRCKVPRARAEALKSILPLESKVTPLGKRYHLITFPAKYVTNNCIERAEDDRMYVQTVRKLAGQCIRPGIMLVTGKQASGFRRLRRSLFSAAHFERNSLRVFTANRTNQFRAKICTRSAIFRVPHRHFHLEKKTSMDSDTWIELTTEGNCLVVDGVRISSHM